MGRVQLRKNLDLLLNILYFILGALKVDYLDGYCLLRSLVVSGRAHHLSSPIIGALTLGTRTLYKPPRTIPCLENHANSD
jgi:hypothetical protein